MIEKIKQDLHERYAEKKTRLKHVMGVVSTAKELAALYGESEEKAEIAALLHDITKYESREFHIEKILSMYDASVLDAFSEPLWHAFSACVVAKKTYGIVDSDILNAIESHTVGRSNMSMLEKIIFIADYIEPSRTYPSCVKVRPIAYFDLDRAVYEAVYHSINLFERLGGHVPSRAYETLEFYQPKGENHEQN